MSIRILRGSAWACVLILASASQAQNASDLTLKAAIERSWSANPELKAFRYELDAQSGRIEQAGARPALEIGITAEDLFGSGNHKSVDDAETTLTVGWVWERGVRQHRLRAAEENLAALKDEAQTRRFETAAETARRFVALLTHQQELKELRRSLSLAEQTHAAVRIRVDAAKAPEAEAARSYAQLARARLDFEHEEHELLTASAKLATMWGQRTFDDETPVVVVRGDLFALPTLPSYPALTARLKDNPSLTHLLTIERVRDAELELAKAQRPSWQFRAGVRRFETDDEAALVFGMTVPLSDRRQIQGAIAVARAHVEQSRMQSEATGIQLVTELFAMYQEMKHAITEATSLRDEVLPRMEAALEQAKYAYERGRYSYMEWLATQKEVTEVRRSLIEAAANAHRYRIEIERLIGATVHE